MATQWTAGTTSGQVLTSATLNTIGATSESFTPTIVGAGGGAITIGNGTLTGNYFRIQKMVVVTYLLTIGSTTTNTTSGLWLFSVPIGNALRGNAAGRILDAGSTYYRVTGLAASNKMILQATDTGNEVKSDTPMTWATNDTLNVTFIYETDA
jgi:hypothetical protein